MSTKAMLLTSFGFATIFIAATLFARTMGWTTGRQGNAGFLMAWACFFPLLFAFPTKRSCMCAKRS